MEKDKILAGGLWLKPDGLLAKKISKHNTEVLPLIGLDTVGQRLKVLYNSLQDNPDATLIGHSAGCLLILKAMQDGLLEKTKKVILLNPAPLRGMMFTPRDPVWSKTPKYLFGKMIWGEKVLLSDEDTMNFLSLSREELTSLGDSFGPESGKFMLNTSILGQVGLGGYGRNPAPISGKRYGVDITVVTEHNDRMIGHNRYRIANAFCNDTRKVFRTSQNGHIDTLLFYPDTLAELNGGFL